MSDGTDYYYNVSGINSALSDTGNWFKLTNEISLNPFIGNIIIDPATGGAQPGIRFNSSSYIDFYDATGTFTRFGQVGPNEFWITSSGSTDITVFKGGQWLKRDSGGIETPYSLTKEVATYAAMIADGTPATAMTTYKVATDENKSAVNTIYQWYASGKRLWLGTTADN